jgi:hypothetical protein
MFKIIAPDPPIHNFFKIPELLKLIIDDPEKLERFIIENSDLPGPRANLELAFLPFCSAVSLGRLSFVLKFWNTFLRIWTELESTISVTL